MEQVILSAPAITLAEALFLSFAVVVILSIPAAAAWANSRAARQRIEPTFGIALEPPIAGALPEGAQKTSAEPAWLEWPVSPPVPSFDPWHPEVEQERASTTTEGTALPPGASLQATTEGGGTIPDKQNIPPRIGAILEWYTPAGRYSSLPELFLTASETPTTSLEDLRVVSLATWPGMPGGWPAEVRDLWAQGVEISKKWQSSLLHLAVPLPPGSETYTLARIETDGARFRFHFLIFDQLWPSHMDEAAAICIVDVDPERGPFSWCVVPPIVTTSSLTNRTRKS